ncbi:hypothetical protein [Bosea sp. AAP35]|uniref:hypothetical protein n=1 Tax=Bosea sp. AAP35 TaxID=1523417 RepID=UPI0012E315FE|nr:hypothetical protein [Bosea sp. AAP35]
MLTPDDHSGHGNKLGYLDQPKQEQHDPEMFAVLTRLREAPRGQRLMTVETSGALTDAVFFNEIVPEQLVERQLWFRRASAALAQTDLIFFDPDNGIEVKSIAMGRKKSSKYVYLDELAAAYRAGHSMLIYQHFPMKPHDAFIRETAENLLRVTEPAAEIWAIRTPHVVFMLVIQPRHHAALSGAAHAVRETADRKFLDAQVITAASQ